MSITTLEGELEGILHGTSLNHITNIYGIIDRAGRQLLLDIDPQETKRLSQMTNPIFNSVYDYTIPTDLKGNKVIDLRPQVNRYKRDNYTQTYNKNFDINKDWSLAPSFTIQHNTGVKTIRINNKMLPMGATLDTATSITGNGTWAVDGTTATDLTTDDVQFVAGSSSLKFNLAASGSTGYIQNSTLTAVDLTDYQGQSTIFYYVYLPTASNFTSLNIRWGSDTSNYWTSTATTDFFGNALVNGWNLIAANWNAATTKVGSPVYTAVDYVRISYNYDGTAQTGVKLNNIVCRLGNILEIEYYSKYLFRNASTGAWQETVLDDSDLINLDTESFNALVYLTALYCVQQALGQDATSDINFFQMKYDEKKKLNIMDYCPYFSHYWKLDP
jgi:hypothetical protein